MIGAGRLDYRGRKVFFPGYELGVGGKTYKVISPTGFLFYFNFIICPYYVGSFGGLIFLPLNGILVNFSLLIDEQMYYNYVGYSYIKFLFDDRRKRLWCLQ